MAKTFAEQVAALKATREKKFEELKAVAQKGADESRSMDNAEQEAFDTLQEEIDRIDGDIRRLSVLADMDKKTIEPVEKDAKSQEPAQRGIDIQLKKTESVEKGIGFARYARVKALSKLEGMPALDIAQALYPNHGALHDAFGKAAVPAASTTDIDWAKPLLLDSGAFFADFIEFLRPMTIIGQVSDKLRSLPFDTPVLVQTEGGAAQWVKEGHAKPLTSWKYDTVRLAPRKVAAIAAATKETLKRASASADVLIRDELARACAKALDERFIATTAGTANTSPDGVLHEATVLQTVLTGSGSHGSDGIRCDIAEFMGALVDANLSLAGAFWLMSERTAINLSMITNLAGGAAFPGITPQGGTLAGLPVITSQYVPDVTAGQTVALVKGDEIFLGDEGGVEVSMSDQASLVMADDAASSMNSTTPTATSVVSMFQTNSVAFLVERTMTWKKRRSEAAVYGYVQWDCGL